VLATTCPAGLPLCADGKSASLGTLCRASAQADHRHEVPRKDVTIG